MINHVHNNKFNSIEYGARNAVRGASSTQSCRRAKQQSIIFFQSIELVIFSNSAIFFFRYFLLLADKAPSEATFRGTEFLSYDLGQTGGEPIVSAQDAISLYFRTRQPNGLLFYTSELKFPTDTNHKIFNIFKINGSIFS